MVLKSPINAQRHTFVHNQIEPHKARAKGLKEYAELSATEREWLRIKQAEKKDWLYAGRRQDLKDINGHHPFFGSIYPANYSRRLNSDGIKWLYSKDAFFLKVPKNEKRISQKSLMIEPEFYLPNKDLHLLIIPNRRFVNNGCRQSSLPERIQRAQVAKELLAEKGIAIEIIYPDELEAISELETMETLPCTEYKPIGREASEGDNIQNNPEKFLLEKCNCNNCNQ